MSSSEIEHGKVVCGGCGSLVYRVAASLLSGEYLCLACQDNSDAGSAEPIRPPRESWFHGRRANDGDK